MSDPEEFEENGEFDDPDEGILQKIISEKVDAEISKREVTTGNVINKTLTTANKEYPIELPARTKKFTMHLRESDTVFKVAFERGSVDGAAPAREYFTVKANGDYWEDNLNLEEIFKIYVACASAGKTVEVVAWR